MRLMLPSRLRLVLAFSLTLLCVFSFPSNIFAQQGGVVGPVTSTDEARLVQFEQS